MDSPAASPATPVDSSTRVAAPAAVARPAWLSWLARAVPISGWNGSSARFDHQDFLWCPRHAGTSRQCERTRLTSTEQARQIIERIPDVLRQSVASDAIARNHPPTGGGR
jgi:hypothetical protein